MKTESRKHHELSVIVAATIMGLVMLACTCNLLTPPNGQGQGTPTQPSGSGTPTHTSGPGTPTQTSSPGTPTHTSGPGTPTSTQPGSGAQAACLAGVFPGTTTRNEAVALLGEPLGVVPEGDLETLLYASSLPRQFNSIVVQSQVVALVSIVLGEDNPQAWSAIKAQYGEPAHTTYNNYMEGSMTFIYPEKGQTFVASPEVDAVFIRECFVPMTLADYMSTWGSSLPTEDPFIR